MTEHMNNTGINLTAIQTSLITKAVKCGRMVIRDEDELDEIRALVNDLETQMVNMENSIRPLWYKWAIAKMPVKVRLEQPEVISINTKISACEALHEFICRIPMVMRSGGMVEL